MAEVKRDEKGRVISGALNPGGRAGARLRRLGERIGTDTDDFLTIYKKVLKVAGMDDHPHWRWAVEFLASAFYGPFWRKTPEPDEANPFADATDEELKALVEQAETTEAKP